MFLAKAPRTRKDAKTQRRKGPNQKFSFRITNFGSEQTASITNFQIPGTYATPVPRSIARTIAGAIASGTVATGGTGRPSVIPVLMNPGFTPTEYRELARRG